MTLSRANPGKHGAAIAAALLFVAMLALFWPGIAMYDSVSQYRQALTGDYADWHPPVMARLWSLLLWMGGGQAPMFVLQAALYWLGLGLIATRLSRLGETGVAIAVLAIGIWPPFAGWEAAVLKDCQMASALLAAVGLVAWWRLDGRPVPTPARVIVVVLLTYATLVRANAVFATVPLAVALFAGWRWRGWMPRAAAIAVATLVVLAMQPWINHQLLGAKQSNVARSLPVFDLAGIVHRAGPNAVPLLPAADWREMDARKCAQPLLWDPLDDGERCDFIANELAAKMPHGSFYPLWLDTIRRHPLAYAGHRLAHWNDTMRWIVPFHLPLSLPPAGSEPNDLGLRSAGKPATRFDSFAGWLANGPLGAPILCFGLALAVLALARPEKSAGQGLAVALALSSAAMETSFLVVSVSSDWRYHLWSMLAATLAVVLLAREGIARRGGYIALAALLLVAGTSFVARLVLPPVGDGYAEAIGEPNHP
jgi:hypothetical protein